MPQLPPAGDEPRPAEVLHDYEAAIRELDALQAEADAERFARWAREAEERRAARESREPADDGANRWTFLDLLELGDAPVTPPEVCGSSTSGNVTS